MKKIIELLAFVALYELIKPVVSRGIDWLIARCKRGRE